jgi:hypothetical protein
MMRMGSYDGNRYYVSKGYKKINWPNKALFPPFNDGGYHKDRLNAALRVGGIYPMDRVSVKPVSVRNELIAAPQRPNISHLVDPRLTFPVSPLVVAAAGAK